MLNYANEKLDIANHYRELRKDSRTRFGFLASSPKGLVKGYLGSVALNATSGLAHSIFNTVGSIKDQWKINSELDKVLRDQMSVTTIGNWLRRDLEIVEEVAHAYALYMCRSYFNKEDVLKWQNESVLFLNLYPYLGVSQDKMKCLVRGLQYDPYNKGFYYYLLRDFYYNYSESKNIIDSFAKKLGIDISLIERKLNNARTFNGVLYDTIEQCSDVAARTYNDITYNTIEECKQAEQNSTYKGKKYFSLEAATEAKEMDEEKAAVKEVISTVNRNDRNSLLQAITQLEEMDLKYNKERLRKLKKRYNELGYDKAIEEFKAHINSFDNITEDDKTKCLEIIQKAKRHATERDNKEINRIIYAEIKKKVSRLNQRFDDNLLEYEGMKGLFHKKTKKIYPHILAGFCGGMGLFIVVAIFCSVASSIYCLVHFFQTLGTGYTLADGMFFGYLIIAFLLFILYGEIDIDGPIDKIEDTYCNSYWGYHAEYKFSSFEKEFDKLLTEYDYYNSIMNKIGSNINKKEIPEKFSQSELISLYNRKISNMCYTVSRIYTVVIPLITIGIFVLALFKVLKFSPPKEKEEESGATITSIVQTPTSQNKPALSDNKLTLKVGQSHKLKLINKNGKIKWSTSNRKIADVSPKGKVKAKKAGKAKVKAKVGKKEYICKVTVK